MDEYMDLLDRYGPGTSQVKAFEEQHRADLGLAELSSTVHDLEASARRARWARGLVQLAWVFSFCAVGLIAVLAMYRGTQARIAQETLALDQAGWGWTRPGALPENMGREQYLTHLADGAHEWFDVKPVQPVDLAKRLGEFRKGCSVLLLSRHQPLPDDDRQWLEVKCRAWAASLDHAVAQVELHRDATAVRENTAEFVDTLVNELRNRAQQQQAEGKQPTAPPGG
jgi:hypothetical protein